MFKLASNGVCVLLVCLLLSACVPPRAWLKRHTCTVDVYGQSQCSDVEMD